MGGRPESNRPTDPASGCRFDTLGSMAHEDADDETLMLRYRDGDATAFDELYARHRQGLFRFCLRLCGDAGRAEEVFQDAWISLVNARGRYRVEAQFRTWLFQIARNRVIDVMRRDGRIAFSLDDEVGAAFGQTLAAPQREQPDNVVGMRRRVESIVAAVEALPPAQREAFLLHQEGDMTLEEIAALTGVGRETAKSRLRYALNRLRGQLADG